MNSNNAITILKVKRLDKRNRCAIDMYYLLFF